MLLNNKSNQKWQHIRFSMASSDPVDASALDESSADGLAFALANDGKQLCHNVSVPLFTARYGNILQIFQILIQSLQS